MCPSQCSFTELTNHRQVKGSKWTKDRSISQYFPSWWVRRTLDVHSNRHERGTKGQHQHVEMLPDDTMRRIWRLLTQIWSAGVWMYIFVLLSEEGQMLWGEGGKKPFVLLREIKYQVFLNQILSGLQKNPFVFVGGCVQENKMFSFVIRNVNTELSFPPECLSYAMHS